MAKAGFDQLVCLGIGQARGGLLRAATLAALAGLDAIGDAEVGYEVEGDAAGATGAGILDVGGVERVGAELGVDFVHRDRDASQFAFVVEEWQGLALRVHEVVERDGDLHGWHLTHVLIGLLPQFAQRVEHRAAVDAPIAQGCRGFPAAATPGADGVFTNEADAEREFACGVVIVAQASGSLEQQAEGNALGLGGVAALRG